MKELVDTCKNHSYVWIKTETVVSTEPYLRIIPKDIYACVDCGLAMEIYKLDEKIDINRDVVSERKL